MRDGDDQNRARQAARERGAKVLKDLMTRAGVAKFADLERRSKLAEVKLSDQTISNALNAKVTIRDSTVRNFIDACLYEQSGNPRLAGDRMTVPFWKARYDHAVGRDSAAGLVRIGREELPPAPVVFVDRPDVEQLAAAVDAGESVVLTPHQPRTPDPGTANKADGAKSANPGGGGKEQSAGVRVLSGMGGVGKSQLAAHYARQVWDDESLDLAIWVSARDASAVVTAYAEAAARVLGADPRRPEQAAGRLMSWLSTTTWSWLIVLDDVQLPSQVQQWWPDPTAAGQVIVTTRYRGEGLNGHGRRIVEVGLYTPEQARDYLQRRLADVPHLYSGPDGRTPAVELLDGLAADLGWLPLALAHAAAYLLLEQDLSVQDYRDRFQDNRTALSTLFPHLDESPDPYLGTVATTWQISMDLAARLAPGGLVPVVMLLASLLDPNGIPRAAFTAKAVTWLLEHMLERDVPEREVWSVVRKLHRLSLLTVDLDTAHSAVRVHALVQRATRDNIHNADKLAPTACAAAVALVEIWPSEDRDLNLAATLRSNTQALEHVAAPVLWASPGYHVLLRAGRSMNDVGPVHDAVNYSRRLATDAHTHLGPDHPDTLIARANLAVARRAAGDPAGAATAFAELLTDQNRVLGHDHPHTFTVRNHLAVSQAEAGDPAGAATALAELLTDQTRVLGPDHPDTLTTRNNLAVLRRAAGQPARAADALAELLTQQIEVLGPDHPNTLAARGNLAISQAQSGDPAGAATAFAELLIQQIKALGPDHPNTLTARKHLALARAEAGDPAGAATALAELLTDQIRVLGPDHPDTLATRNHLAVTRAKAGDPAGAATAFAELLTQQIKALGPDDPDALTTRSNLAIARAKAGDLAGAADAFAELLTRQIKALGPLHPDTLATHYDLAVAWAEAGDLAHAMETLNALLPAQSAVLGPKHPGTLATYNYLANCLEKIRRGET
ncbi:tetratricopeptide repeat protein [Amycolatopsis sp. cmx-4-61]|uniref:tetratricopeptide repeat protein n=1 Tax=Amycolatopsis sp. cmx-4-61 TaxID=2790937 RepID=UPI00397BACB9